MIITLVLGVLAVLSGLVLWRTIKHDPRTMWLGVWFIVTFGLIVMTIGAVMIGSGTIGLAIFAAIFIGIFGILIIASYFFNLAVIYYSWQIWRKEYHTISNLLLPILFLVLLAFNFIGNLMAYAPIWLSLLFGFARLMESYFIMLFILFLISAVVYGRVTRRQEADYYVVLGAGLINGERVSTLLANRIKAAVTAANVVAEKTGKQPKIVFSGGKGSDESLSEAEAMQRYAIQELGFPVEQTLLEDQSRNTRENMRFSREIIAKDSQQSNPRFVYFTSEYHVFRASLQARQFGVMAQGRSGKTAFYYRIPAFIREYIAVLNMHRRFHMILTAVFLILTILLIIVNYLVQLF